MQAKLLSRNSGAVALVVLFLLVQATPVQAGFGGGVILPVPPTPSPQDIAEFAEAAVDEAPATLDEALTQDSPTSGLPGSHKVRSDDGSAETDLLVSPFTSANGMKFFRMPALEPGQDITNARLWVSGEAGGCNSSSLGQGEWGTSWGGQHTLRINGAYYDAFDPCVVFSGWRLNSWGSIAVSPSVLRPGAVTSFQIAAAPSYGGTASYDVDTGTDVHSTIYECHDSGSGHSCGYIAGELMWYLEYTVVDVPSSEGYEGKVRTVGPDQGLICDSVECLMSPPVICLNNDDRACAKEVAKPSSSSQSTEGYTMESGEPGQCNGWQMQSTAWFAYRASTTGFVTVTSQASDFSTVLAVRYNNFNGNPLGCDAHTGTSTVRFYAYAGSTYQFQVGGYGGGSGDLVLRVT